MATRREAVPSAVQVARQAVPSQEPGVATDVMDVVEDATPIPAVVGASTEAEVEPPYATGVGPRKTKRRTAGAQARKEDAGRTAGPA